MRVSLFLFVLIAVSVFAAACGGTEGGSGPATGGGDTPTDAYKKLYAAVKAKNTDAIKAQMTKKSLDFAQMVSQRNNTPIDKVFENGFTATTFAESLPKIRDERISGDMGAIEVWNGKDNRWEDLGFIKEDGAWKFAVGDLWAGTYKSPGMGRAQKEKEAANAISNNMIRVDPPANVNSNVKPIVPTERQQPQSQQPPANMK